MEKDDRTIWKMPLKSRREDFEEDPYKNDRARQFCFDNGWLGIGWECESLPDNIQDPKEYQQALLKDRADDHAAYSAHRALAYKMQKGDLVWCRAKGDIYWLAKVAGLWRYRNTGKFQELDLYQTRKCRWQKVGPGDTVPGPVKNAYAGRGSAISRIRRERDVALYLSVSIWKKLTGETIQHTPTKIAKFSLSSVGHDDLEDLVALYLQAELGWYLVPSTAKRSNPVTEFVLRNSEGKCAYVQVKSGETRVDQAVEIPTEVDKFFVFDLEPSSQHMKNRKFERIDAFKLSKFALTHKCLLPEYMRGLIFEE